MRYVPTPHGAEMTAHLSTGENAALFAGCGLGKTAATLAYLEEQIREGLSPGALVIAPIRVCSITWPAEVAKWDEFRWLRVAHLRTPEGRKAWFEGTAEIYLINPEQLQRWSPVLFGKKRGKATKIPVDTLVWDELSQTKNPSSKRVKALRPYLSKFKQRIGLTGTPVPNSYLDLFAQVRLLDLGKRFGLAYTRYQKEFFDSDYMGYKWEIKPGAKEIIDERIKDLALVMESEDYLDVPEVEKIDVEVVLPAKARAIYNDMEDDFFTLIEGSDVEASTAAVRTMKLVQITSGAVYDDDGMTRVVHHAKLDALSKLLEKINEPVLILSMFRHERARIMERFGATEFHENLLPEWRAGRIPVMVAQPQMMSHGIDGLQDGGRILIWASPTYSHEMDVQTNARLIRQGQTKRTLVYRLIARGTVDEAVADAVREKASTEQGLLASLKAYQKLR